MSAAKGAKGAKARGPARRRFSAGRVLGALLALAVVGIAAAAAWLYVYASRPVSSRSERVSIPPGASFREVTDSLASHGLVHDRLWFKLLARVKQVDRNVRAGIYAFPAGVSSAAILETLSNGQLVTARFTVPEGLTISQVAALAEERLAVPRDSFLAAARDAALAESLGVAAPTLEGFLQPETYLVPIAISARELTRLMVDGFLEQWSPAWDARLDSMRLTRLQAVTLASIVEGEARADEEREIIAGVYHNRLRIGMALQADPTVQYAIEQATGSRKPRLFEKDYQIDSRYNTYRYPGLPPGPVNSPSRRSVQATLYPATVPYLYFVARPDGHHMFARSYTEHLRNVATARRLNRQP